MWLVFGYFLIASWDSECLKWTSHPSSLLPWIFFPGNQLHAGSIWGNQVKVWIPLKWRMNTWTCDRRRALIVHALFINVYLDLLIPCLPIVWNSCVLFCWIAFWQFCLNHVFTKYNWTNQTQIIQCTTYYLVYFAVSLQLYTIDLKISMKYMSEIM